MIKGSEKRKADHAIESLILDRWSPCDDGRKHNQR